MGSDNDFLNYGPVKLTAKQKKWLLDKPTTDYTHQEPSNDDDLRRAPLQKPAQPSATESEFKPLCESGAAGRHTILQKWGPLKGDILEIQNIEYRVKEVKGQNLVLRPTGRIRQRME